VWVLLRQGGSEKQLRTMVSDRALPVLEDDVAANVDQFYGLSGSRPYLIFSRDGCLLPIEGQIPPQTADTPPKLLPYIERAAK
jgi:hypothetical protein